VASPSLTVFGRWIPPEDADANFVGIARLN
jgi:hypothetical protein